MVFFVPVKLILSVAVIQIANKLCFPLGANICLGYPRGKKSGAERIANFIFVIRQHMPYYFDTGSKELFHGELSRHSPCVTVLF